MQSLSDPIPTSTRTDNLSHRPTCPHHRLKRHNLAILQAQLKHQTERIHRLNALGTSICEIQPRTITGLQPQIKIWLHTLANHHEFAKMVQETASIEKQMTPEVQALREIGLSESYNHPALDPDIIAWDRSRRAELNAAWKELEDEWEALCKMGVMMGDPREVSVTRKMERVYIELSGLYPEMVEPPGLPRVVILGEGWWRVERW